MDRSTAVRAATAVFNGQIGGTLSSTVVVRAPRETFAAGPDATDEAVVDAARECFEQAFSNQMTVVTLLDPEAPLLPRPVVHISVNGDNLQFLCVTPGELIGGDLVIFGHVGKLRFVTHAFEIDVSEYAAAFRRQDAIRWAFHDRVSVTMGNGDLPPPTVVHDVVVVAAWPDDPLPELHASTGETWYTDFKEDSDQVGAMVRADTALCKIRHYGQLSWNRAVFRADEARPDVAVLVFGVHDDGWGAGHGSPFDGVKNGDDLEDWVDSLVEEGVNRWLWGLFPPVDDSAVEIRSWWSEADGNGIVAVFFDLLDRSNARLPVIDDATTLAYDVPELETYLARSDETGETEVSETGVPILDVATFADQAEPRDTNGRPGPVVPSLPPLAVFDRLHLRSPAPNVSALLRRTREPDCKLLVVGVGTKEQEREAVAAVFAGDRVDASVKVIHLKKRVLKPTATVEDVKWFLDPNVAVVVVVGRRAGLSDESLAKVRNAIKAICTRTIGAAVSATLVFVESKAAAAALAIARNMPWRVVDCLSATRLARLADALEVAPDEGGDSPPNLAPLRVVSAADFERPADADVHSLRDDVLSQTCRLWHGGDGGLVRCAVVSGIADRVNASATVVIVGVTNAGCGTTTTAYQVAHALLGVDRVVAFMDGNEAVRASQARTLREYARSRSASVVVVADRVPPADAHRLQAMISRSDVACAVVAFSVEPETFDVQLSPLLTTAEVIGIRDLLLDLWDGNEVHTGAINDWYQQTTAVDKTRHLSVALLSAFTGQVVSIASFALQLFDLDPRVRGLAALSLYARGVLRPAALESDIVRNLVTRLGPAARYAFVLKGDGIALIHDLVATELVGMDDGGLVSAWDRGFALALRAADTHPDAVSATAVSDAFRRDDNTDFSPSIEETLATFGPIRAAASSLIEQISGKTDQRLFEFACHLIIVRLHVALAGDNDEALLAALAVADRGLASATELETEVPAAENVILKAVSVRCYVLEVRARVVALAGRPGDAVAALDAADAALADLGTLEDAGGGDVTADDRREALAAIRASLTV